MKTTFLIGTIASFGLCAAVAEKVSLEQVPQPVQKTLKATQGQGVVTEIEKETRDGKTVYEFEFKSPGLNPKLRIAEDGQVVKDTRLGANEIDRGKRRDPSNATDKEASRGMLLPRVSTLRVSDLPAKVQETAQKMAAGREIVDVDKETWDGLTVYEVEFAQAGRNGQVHINEEGTVVKYDDAKNLPNKAPRAKNLFGVFLGTQLEDTPAAVQDTIRKEAKGGNISDIDKEMRDGRVIYEVEIKQSPGRNYELHVAENGTIVRDSRLQEAAGARIEEPVTDLSRPVNEEKPKENSKDSEVK